MFFVNDRPVISQLVSLRSRIGPVIHPPMMFQFCVVAPSNLIPPSSSYYHKPSSHLLLYKTFVLSVLCVLYTHIQITILLFRRFLRFQKLESSNYFLSRWRILPLVPFLVLSLFPSCSSRYNLNQVSPTILFCGVYPSTLQVLAIRSF